MADISSLNSSNTPLLALATFVGQFEYVKDYSSISVTVDADVDSTFNGVTIEWSSTGLSADIESQSFTFDAASGLTVHVTCRAPFYRLKYENSVTGQTSFNLISILRREPPTATVRTIDPVNTFTPNLDVQTVQAILSGVGRFNTQQVLLPALDDVNIGESFLFVSPRPGQIDNVFTKVVTATLSPAALNSTAFSFERFTFLSITNNVKRGNLYIQLRDGTGLSPTNFDYKIPAGHTWQDPGQFGTVYPGEIWGVWDELYIHSPAIQAGNARTVGHFYG